MDAIIEHIEAGYESDFTQVTLIKRFVTGTGLLLDEARRRMADINAMVFGISEHSLSLQLIAFCLEKILALSIKLWSP